MIAFSLRITYLPFILRVDCTTDFLAALLLALRTLPPHAVELPLAVRVKPAMPNIAIPC
jgi:hypothetical protein